MSDISSNTTNQTNATMQPVNLQLIDIPAIFKGSKQQSSNQLVFYHQSEILTDVTKFGILRNKIHDLLVKKNGTKAAKMQTVQYRYVGYVRTFINKLTLEHLATLGITEKQRKDLYESMNKFCNDAKPESEETRRNNEFTQAERESVKDLVGRFKYIRDLIVANYERVAVSYENANVENYRYDIEKAIHLVLYVLEPNVRNAYHDISPDGNCLHNNIIVFGKNKRVTVVFNRMKRDFHMPIVYDVSKYTANVLRKYYETFYKGKRMGPLFLNSENQPWSGHTWTNCVTRTFKEIFEGNLTARIMRVKSLMFRFEENPNMTENEKIALAELYGQSYTPNQLDLYNRHKETARVDKGKKRAIEHELDEGGSSSKKSDTRERLGTCLSCLRTFDYNVEQNHCRADTCSQECYDDLVRENAQD